jgi:hypothetical protein
MYFRSANIFFQLVDDSAPLHCFDGTPSFGSDCVL